MNDTMKTYYISITEMLNRVVAVDAKSLEQAFTFVKNACQNEDITLTSEDYVGYELDDETEETEGLINEGYVNIENIQKISNL